MDSTLTSFLVTPDLKKADVDEGHLTGFSSDTESVYSNFTDYNPSRYSAFSPMTSFLGPDGDKHAHSDMSVMPEYEDVQGELEGGTAHSGKVNPQEGVTGPVGPSG